MNIINLTPHAISIYDRNGEHIADLAPSGQAARIETRAVWESYVQVFGYTVPLFKTEATGEPVCNPVTDGKVNAEVALPFPEYRNDAILVVSGLFRSAYDRADLYQPGELIRDESGKVVGCVGLTR